MSVDLYIGNEQPNPSWIGALQFYFHLPSAGIYSQFVSQIELTGLPRDRFTTLQIPIPANVAAALSESHDDFRIEFALNTNAGSGPYYLDNIRFVSP
jgi:hypothetical protein